MNQSFEIILNHQDYVRFQEIQRQNKSNIALVQQLKQERQNIKLKFQHMEIKCREQELKIKELSMNSIRLSKRLILQQEQHQKTQQYLLHREKELLQKILSLANEHQAILAEKSKKANKEMENQMSNLTKRINEKDKLIDNLTASLAEKKKEIQHWQERCQLAQRQFVEEAKKNNQLKVDLQTLMLEKQKIAQKTYKIKMEYKKEKSSRQSQVRLLTQELQKANLQLNQSKAFYQGQINGLVNQLQLKSEQINKLVSEKDKKITKQQQVIHKLKKILETLMESVKQQGKQIKKNLAQYQSFCKELKIQAQFNIKRQGIKKDKQEIIWTPIMQNLSSIRNQLHIDGITENIIMITIVELQFDSIINNIKKKYLKPWLIN